MPNFPIIDSHVHLWDPQQFPIAWTAGDPMLDQRYGLAEYNTHTQGIEIEAFVYLEVDVEPSFKLLEAHWAATQAQADPRLQGIVASAPLEYGTRVRSFLAALHDIGPIIKGVRRLLQGEPDPAFCLRPDFLQGVRLLPEYGFSFDICISHVQLASTVTMVRECPETMFILDHIGKPAIKDHLLDPWRAQIEELAALPNVMCKVSGVVTEADHQDWTSEDLAPYITHVLDAFGEDRVVFGGDWPVVLLASSYARWVETLDALSEHLSNAAKRKLWVENARRFYRLGSAK